MGKKIKFGLVLSQLLALLLFALPVAANDAQSDTRRLMQIAEYISVDYSVAVANNEVISAPEYGEMQEFAALAVEKSKGLDNATTIVATALRLQQAINDKQNPDVIKPITVELRNHLMEIAPAISLSDHLLNTEQTQALFKQNCIACHGEKGMGDGPLAHTLEPSPTNFTDKTRAENRSLVGLYDAITNGLAGTGMRAFTELSEQERWSLAFYAGSLAFADSVSEQTVIPKSLSMHQFVSNSPVTLAAETGISRTTIDQLRANPTPLFNSKADPLMIAKQQLQNSYQSYSSGNLQLAQSQAVSAYLDGFELAENALDAYDSTFRKEIEVTLMAFRQLTTQSDQQAALQETLNRALTQIERAQGMLSADTLSDSTLFTASIVILLREGLEALLVVLALVTVLVKTERKDAVKYIHGGWITAVLAGFATWWAAQHLIGISGASREIMEGVAALLAAVVLFYVGFWMHSKTSAQSWQAYIKNNIHKHLSAGTLWGLSGLAFIAVYREVFETVLFYQSLMTQSLPTQMLSITTGFVAGLVVLAIIAWLMVKFSLRLPIRKFFSFTTYLMLLLAFILMGKAIAALQEAALINISPLPVSFNLSWLGIHPTWEGIGAQLLIVVLSLIMLTGFRPFSTKQAA